MNFLKTYTGKMDIPRQVVRKVKTVVKKPKDILRTIHPMYRKDVDNGDMLLSASAQAGKDGTSFKVAKELARRYDVPVLVVKQDEQNVKQSFSRNKDDPGIIIRKFNSDEGAKYTADPVVFNRDMCSGSDDKRYFNLPSIYLINSLSNTDLQKIVKAFEYAYDNRKKLRFVLVIDEADFVIGNDPECFKTFVLTNAIEFSVIYIFVPATPHKIVDEYGPFYPENVVKIDMKNYRTFNRAIHTNLGFTDGTVRYRAKPDVPGSLDVARNIIRFFRRCDSGEHEPYYDFPYFTETGASHPVYTLVNVSSVIENNSATFNQVIRDDFVKSEVCVFTNFSSGSIGVRCYIPPKIVWRLCNRLHMDIGTLEKHLELSKLSDGYYKCSEPFTVLLGKLQVAGGTYFHGCQPGKVFGEMSSKLLIPYIIQIAGKTAERGVSHGAEFNRDVYGNTTMFAERWRPSIAITPIADSKTISNVVQSINRMAGKYEHTINNVFYFSTNDAFSRHSKEFNKRQMLDLYDIVDSMDEKEDFGDAIKSINTVNFQNRKLYGKKLAKNFYHKENFHRKIDAYNDRKEEKHEMKEEKHEMKEVAQQGQRDIVKKDVFARKLVCGKKYSRVEILGLLRESGMTNPQGIINNLTEGGKHTHGKAIIRILASGEYQKIE